MLGLALALASSPAQGHPWAPFRAGEPPGFGAAVTAGVGTGEPTAPVAAEKLPAPAVEAADGAVPTVAEGPVPPGTEGPEVTEVAVALKIVRGGERRADGRRVARSAAVVVAEATYTLARPAREGEQLVLLNFAEALTRDPVELDEVARASYLDGPFRRGRLRVVGDAGGTATQGGPRNDVVVRLDAGAEQVTLEYEVEVPRRYWPFGCSQRRCSLSGAVAPLPSAPARGGTFLPPDGRVLAPARWSVDARFMSVPTWSPGHVPDAQEQAALGGDEIVVTTAPIGADKAAYPEVFWGRRWKRARAVHRGVRIEVLHVLWRPGDQVPAERRLQLYRDIPGHALQLARETIDVAAAAGIEAAPDSALTVVQGPLRAELAQAHPTAVVISDQLLQVMPRKQWMGFHLAPVARSLLDFQVYGAFVGRHDPSTDLWLHDALAVALLDVWRVRRSQGDEYAGDILRKISFVPIVDNFLYTGQAAFAQSYFRGSEDVTPLRLHPLYFSHQLPTGRRIHEKLDDILRADQQEALYEALVRDRSADPVAVAEAKVGRSLGWFFDQWLGPYPLVDYAVHGVDSARLPDGRWRHAITVRRVAERALVEPVQVVAVERGGQRHFLVWNGDARPNDPATRSSGTGTTDHTFTIETTRALKSVTVDPRARLFEEAIVKRNVDPLYNNRYPTSFRFVYTGFGFEVSASEFLAGETPAARFQSVSGRVLFEMSRRRDLGWLGQMALHRDRESAAAIGGGGTYWFGEKVNRRRRRARLRMYAEVHSLTPRGVDQVGGVRFAQSAALIDDNRRFTLWPERGHRLTLAVAAAETIRFDADRDVRNSMTFSGSWVQIWPLAHNHTIASRLELAVMVPLTGMPEYRSLIRAGGVDGLGAYGGNEIFGRALAIGNLEYRHMFWSNFNVNLVHLFWLRGIGGALFTGAATVSGCDDYRGWFGRESWYGQVGYGVTAFLQLLGVTPQFVRFDVAVPLVRRRTMCLGDTLPDHLAEIQGLQPGEYRLPRVGVNLTFLQPF